MSAALRWPTSARLDYEARLRPWTPGDTSVPVLPVGALAERVFAARSWADSTSGEAQSSFLPVVMRLRLRDPMLAKSRVSSSWVLAALAAQTCAAALLGALYLGRHSLWLDEAATAQLAHLPRAAYWHLVTGSEANSVAYFTLVRGVGAIFGYSEPSVRSLSVVATALTVPAVFAVGAELFDKRTGVVAGLLFSLSPAAVVGAQEARGFALETLLLTCSVLALLRALRTGRRGWWVCWVAMSVLAVYVHLLAILVPGPLAVVAAAWRRTSAVAVRAAAGVALVVACTVPLVYLGHRGGQGGLAFLRGATGRNLRALPPYLAGGSWPEAILLTALVAAAAVAAIAGSRTMRPAAFPTAFCFAWLVGPVLLAALVSLVKPVLSQRYFLFELVPLLVLAARALRLVPRSLQIAATAALVAVGLLGIANVYTRPSRQDWRDATRLVLAQATASDAVVFLPPYYRGPFEYYRERAPQSLRAHTPTPALPAVPWGASTFETQNTTRVARKVIAAASRVWVIRGPVNPRSPPPQAVRARMRAVRTFRFHGVDVALYRRPRHAG
jgi:mannosyltransferase